MFGGDDLLAISDLLAESRKEQEEDEDPNSNARAFFTPATIVKHSKAAQVPQPIGPPDPKAIWQDDEVPTLYALEDKTDPRPEPEYEILYQQDIMSEDMFLGMAGKTPGSQDCTHMVVKVKFPGAKMADLELDVTKERFRAESSILKLSMFLPLPVDDVNGKAKWDASKDTLVVTLPIIRQLW